MQLDLVGGTPQHSGVAIRNRWICCTSAAVFQYENRSWFLFQRARVCCIRRPWLRVNAACVEKGSGHFVRARLGDLALGMPSCPDHVQEEAVSTRLSSRIHPREPFCRESSMVP